MPSNLLDRFNSVKYRSSIISKNYIPLLDIVYNSNISSLIDIARHSSIKVTPELETSYECEVIYKFDGNFKLKFLELQSIQACGTCGIPNDTFNMDLNFKSYIYKNLLTYGVDWAILSIEKFHDEEYNGN